MDTFYSYWQQFDQQWYLNVLRDQYKFSSFEQFSVEKMKLDSKYDLLDTPRHADIQTDLLK